MTKALANLVVVGGPVSVGKSTLVKLLDLPVVNELNEGDALESLLLTLLYEKTRVPNEVVETYFLLKRRDAYINAASSRAWQVLDRSLFESLWFAKHTLDAPSYKAFAKFWTETMQNLLSEYGAPKIYVLLTCNWATFKERLFLRGREFEILNFRQNEAYWKAHITEYESYMRQVFADFNLNFEVVSTDGLDTKEVASIVKVLLMKHQVY